MMCVIVDTNVVAMLLTEDSGGSFYFVREALEKRKAHAVYGGKLAREYAKVARINRVIQELDRQGVFRKVDDKDVDKEENAIAEAGEPLKSDDPHILALARVSKVRLLCSHDKDLHADFTDPGLLKPAGNVFQSPAHRHLIRKHCC